MFKVIAKMLSAREAPKSGFVPPDNRHTGSVPEFRAHLREIGLTETEASAVLVKRALAGFWYLENRGYSFSQILDMPGAPELKMPTDEYNYYDYCRISRDCFERVRLHQTCGLH